MTDAELAASWPDLGIVVRELRALERAGLADRLRDSVQYASTSGEIYDGVGYALAQHGWLRRSLSVEGSAAWDRVMDRVDRAFGGIRPGNWLARRWRRLWRTK